MPFYKTTASGYLNPGWEGSDLRAWINKKMVPAFAPEWQQTMCNTILSSLGGTNPTGLSKISSHADLLAYYNRVETNEKVFIPAYLETMGNPDDGATDEVLEKYKQDKGADADFVSSFEIFTDAASRIKTIRGTDTVAHWWTRTPYMKNAGDSRFDYMKVISKLGESKQHYYSNSAETDQNEAFKFYYPNNEFGVLLAFSV